MYLGIREKAIIASVGVVLAVAFALFFPWWLSLPALFVLSPLFVLLVRA